MADMYEQLGVLLRDALEKGVIPHGDEGEKERDNESPADAVAFRSTRRVRVSSLTRILHTRQGGRSSVLRGAYGGEQNGESGGVSKGNGDGLGRNGRDYTQHIASYDAPPLSPITAEKKAAYALLGVDAGAGEKEVKAAYRAKLKMFHPDENSSNPVVQKVAKQKTIEVMEAYRLLCPDR